MTVLVDEEVDEEEEMMLLIMIMRDRYKNIQLNQPLFKGAYVRVYIYIKLASQWIIVHLNIEGLKTWF